MQEAILDSLEDLGYSGPLMEDTCFSAAVSSEAVTVEFSSLVEWIVTELAALARLEERVHSINSQDESDAFAMELSGFLRECSCPYKCLTEGAVNQRLSSKENKFILVNYLLTELQAEHIVATNSAAACHAWLSNDVSSDSKPLSPAGATSTADLLKEMMISINIPRPPADITVPLLLEKLTTKVSDLISTHPVGEALLKSTLTSSQWEVVEYVSHALRQDYELRRQMLLQRLDVTIQSFTWSDRIKRQQDKMAAFYYPIRQRMNAAAQTDISHLLAARCDLTCMEKCSSGGARERTSCDINRVVMGAVPDRGGRAYELGPPPPEMPSFQQRRGGPGGHRGGGGQQRGWSQGGRRRGGEDFWQAKRGKGRRR